MGDAEDANDRYRALFEALPGVGLYRTTPDGRILDANPALAEILGFPNVEALKRVNTIDLYVDLADRARWRELIERDGVITNLEVRKRRMDGTIVWLRDSARVIRAGNEITSYEGAVIDITAVMSAEAGRKLSEERYGDLVRAIPDAMLRVRADGLCLDATRGRDGVLPIEPEDLIGRALSDVLAPEVARPILAATAACVLDRAPQMFELRVESPEERKLTARVTPVEDDTALVIMHDATQAERMRAQLLRAERLASVGVLAAGVAHEINNPLGYLSTNLELALEACALALGARNDRHAHEALQAMQGALDDALDGALRVRNIVRQLKTFSRSEEPGVGSARLSRVLDTACRMVGNQIRHRARLETTHGDLPRVHGNASRLEQVFVNLLVNAAHAIPEGGADENVVRLEASVDGSHVVVTISDTGTGIQPDDLEHIFDPFFTTKPIGEGTGLGLAVCHDIVTASRGTIDVESMPGQGTTFRVCLEIDEGDSIPAPRRRSARPPSGRGRVLVIDDEPLLGRSLARALERDHDVTVLQDAEEALDQLSHGESYDVILCDVMMPRMGGVELHGELRKRLPDVTSRIIFITGGVFSGAASEYLERLDNPILHKPLSIEEVRRRIDDVLTRECGGTDSTRISP